MRFLKPRYLAVSLCTAAFVLFLSGCGKDQGLRLGVAIPSQSPIKLESILKNPQEYHEKNVVLKGTVKGQCASLCEFFLQEGPFTATVFPQGFTFPRLETGKPVSVYAQITSGPGHVVFSALGIMME